MGYSLNVILQVAAEAAAVDAAAAEAAAATEGAAGQEGGSSGGRGRNNLDLYCCIRRREEVQNLTQEW